jgi:cation transporter-like permease
MSLAQKQTFLTQGERHHQHHKHWHYIYKRRSYQPISWREIALGQIIALSGSLIAGLLLELNKHTLSLFVGAFLLLPGVIDLAASITGAMCAKINHRLETSNETLRIVEGSVLFALMLSVTAGLVVGITGGLIGELFFASSFWKICLLGVTTMIGVGVITYPLMSLLTLFIRRLNVDPDNIIGPVETGFTDMLTVIMVSLLVRVL